jgi:chromosome segregation ATPase
MELQDLLKNVQDQKKILEQQYDNLNQNIEECNLIINGGEGLSQPKVEINNDYIEKCKILEAENYTIKQEIENLNNEIENQKKTNENLEQVIDSMNKESYDNEEILQNLKSTIEKLKMQNKQGSLINSQADLQISKNNSLMQMKQQEIKNLNEKINSLNKELQILKNENKSLLNQMKKKQQENSKGDLINQRLMAEIKSIKENNKVLEECLKDRQKTINDLKNTLKIMGGFGDQNLENNEIMMNDNLSEKKKRLEEIINDTKQKEKQLEEIKKNYMDMIKFKDEKIKELKEKLGY